MTKKDLVQNIQANLNGVTQAEATSAVNAIFDAMADSLADGQTITLSGFGTFKPVDRAARVGRNPQTGQEIRIPETKAVKFTPGKQLKDRVQ